MANKVKFNIHDVHYAPITGTDSSGDLTYGTPVKIEGARSISLEPQNGDREVYYADGIEWYVQSGNGSVEGDLEMALIPDAFRKAIYGETEDADHVLWESVDDESKRFALGFVIDGNEKPTYFWYQNCTATKPNVASQTNEENKTIGSDTITVTCTAGNGGRIRAKSTEQTTASVITGWFTAVVSTPSEPS